MNGEVEKFLKDNDVEFNYGIGKVKLRTSIRVYKNNQLVNCGPYDIAIDFEDSGNFKIWAYNPNTQRLGLHLTYQSFDTYYNQFIYRTDKVLEIQAKQDNDMVIVYIDPLPIY